MTHGQSAKNKKVATSSFIQHEEKQGDEFLPDKANWDASAIEPPIESDTTTKENDPGKTIHNFEMMIMNHKNLYVIIKFISVLF